MLQMLAVAWVWQNEVKGFPGQSRKPKAMHVSCCVSSHGSPSSSGCSGGSHCSPHTHAQTARRIGKQLSGRMHVCKRADRRVSLSVDEATRGVGHHTRLKALDRLAHQLLLLPLALTLSTPHAAGLKHCFTPLVVLCKALLVREVGAAGAAVEASLGSGATWPVLLLGSHGDRRQQQVRLRQYRIPSA